MDDFELEPERRNHPGKLVLARIRKWFRGLDLPTAAILTILGIILFFVFAWYCIGFITIGGFTWEISSAGINRATATQIVLTMVAGAGAAVALVVTYRKQRLLEDSNFLDHLGAAAAKLGDETPAVQFSGIYSLAALADKSTAVRRQQVIDVLCGYLRLPYDSTQSGLAGVQTRVDRVLASTPSGIQKETALTTVHRPGEKEVRATIFKVIGHHLQPDAEVSWSDLQFDFSGAIIDQCDLSHAVFIGKVSFEHATFSGQTYFYCANFSGEQAGGVTFNDATFSGQTYFDGATFPRTPGLGGGTFFHRSKFIGGQTSFAAANFDGEQVSFMRAVFSGGEVDFTNAYFINGSVSFTDAQFSGGVVDFRKPRAWAKPPSVPWKNGRRTPEGVLPRTWPPEVERFPEGPWDRISSDRTPRIRFVARGAKSRRQ